MCSGAGNLRNWLLGSVLAMTLPVLSPAFASTDAPKKPFHAVSAVHHAAHSRQSTTTHVASTRRHLAVARHEVVTHHVVAAHHNGRVLVRAARSHGTVTRWHSRWAGLSCVPYARSASGIELAGNAWQWWGHAAGVYSRGSVPEPGGVLAFRANGRMRLGHVAVVTKVLNDREILIEHANWAGRGIARNVPVVDVSENNDWTAVRVGLGDGDRFGSVYPTYGFIYDRPDTGHMLTAITVPAPTPALNPAPRDLRPIEHHTVVASRGTAPHYDEVAEAPEHPRSRHGIALTSDRH